jgi:hypothetical protein
MFRIDILDFVCLKVLGACGAVFGKLLVWNINYALKYMLLASISLAIKNL